MKYQNISKLSVLILFKEAKNINKILVGVDNLEQLLEIYNIKINKKIKYPKNYIKSEKLINPSYGKNLNIIAIVQQDYLKRFPSKVLKNWWLTMIELVYKRLQLSKYLYDIVLRYLKIN